MAESRRAVLQGALAAGVGVLPLAAYADTFSDLGLKRSDLGLPEPPPPKPLDLAKFRDAEALEKAVSADDLKAQLTLRGLKCGGTPKERAERLFLLKTQKLEDLPKKLLAKPKA
jgi:hypothetical protein